MGPRGVVFTISGHLALLVVGSIGVGKAGVASTEAAKGTMMIAITM